MELGDQVSKMAKLYIFGNIEKLKAFPMQENLHSWSTHRPLGQFYPSVRNKTIMLFCFWSRSISNRKA